MTNELHLCPEQSFVVTDGVDTRVEFTNIYVFMDMEVNGSISRVKVPIAEVVAAYKDYIIN